MFTEDLVVFIAVTQHQRRVDAHQRHAELRHPVEEIGGLARGAGKTRQETFNVLRLAVRRKWQQHRLVAEFFHQPDKVRHHFGVIITGERILHDQHVIFALRGAQPSNCSSVRVTAACPESCWRSVGLDSIGRSTMPMALRLNSRTQGCRKKKLNTFGALAISGV